MPVLTGRAAEDRRRVEREAKIRRVLQAAARAGATVIANGAKERVTSDAVREGVQIGRAREKGERIVVRITVKDGWAQSLGSWLEWGTEGHFIKVDLEASGGRTAQRVNYLDTKAAKEGRAGPGSTLLINGKPVGSTVWHPGSTPHPWLRPARDIEGGNAVKAAQAVINTSLRRSGIIVPDGEE